MPGPPGLLLSDIPNQYRIESPSRKLSLAVRWVDFELVDFEGDYPEVQHFLFRPAKANGKNGRPISALPLDAVDEVDWGNGLVRIGDPDAIRELGEEDIAGAVLLDRDILDAYVVDLQNRRLTRANDLLLAEDGGLHLAAVDTGLRAIFRRLSGGLYQGFAESELQDWKYFEFLRGDPKAARAGARYHRRIERLPPGEISSLIQALPYLHAAELISLLPHQLAADTIEVASPDRQLQVLEELHDADALPILEKMAPDIAADLIGRLTADQARDYLDRLSKRTSERIVDLLRYPEDTVGGIMTNDMIAVPGELTVAEARTRLRKELKDPDFIYFLYVVDDDEHLNLRGVISLRGILVARDDQKLEDIMNPYLETLHPLDSPRQAAYRLINSQLAALPVTSLDGRLLGVVTVDAAVSLVAPGAWSSQAPRIFS